MNEIDMIIHDDIERRARKDTLLPTHKEVNHYISEPSKPTTCSQAPQELACRPFNRKLSMMAHLVENTIARRDYVGLTQKQLDDLWQIRSTSVYEALVIYMFEHNLHFIHRRKGNIDYSFIVSEKVRKELII